MRNLKNLILTLFLFVGVNITLTTLVYADTSSPGIECSTPPANAVYIGISNIAYGDYMNIITRENNDLVAWVADIEVGGHKLSIYEVYDDNLYLKYYYIISSSCDGSFFITLYGIPKNNIPIFNITAPTANSPFSAAAGHNTINIAGTVTDPDSGDVLKTYSRIDGTVGQAGTQFGSNITANGAAQAISGSVNVATLAEGAHNLYTWVEDDKGGKSTETAIAFKVDKSPPIVTYGTNGNTTPAKTQSTTVTVSDPTVNGVTTGISTSQYQWTKTATFPTTGTWTNFASGATITQPNGTGDYYLHIKAIDQVGNTKQMTTNKFVLDNTAPTVTLTHNHPDLIVRDADNVTITATFNEAMATTSKITISNAGVTNVNMTMGANNRIWTYNWNVPATNVTATVTVAGTDLAGNAYAGTNKIIFTVDNIAPTLSISAPSATTAKNGTNVTYTINYTGADSISLAPAYITLNKTGNANGTISVSGTGIATRIVTISNITGDGTIGMSIAVGTASDIAGNASAASGPSATSIVDNTAPILNANATYTITTNSIKIAPDVKDPLVNAVNSGLHLNKYLFSKYDHVNSIWIDGSWATEDYIDTGLTTNERYRYRYKAKDALGNESGWLEDIEKYTYANIPSIELNNVTQESIDGSIKYIN